MPAPARKLLIVVIDSILGKFNQWRVKLPPFPMIATGDGPGLALEERIMFL
jgi:hypothetical protein